MAYELPATGDKDTLWSKDYIIVMLASTGLSFCNYFFFSTLPIYALRLTGTAAYSGLMIGVYTFAALAIRPAAGILADKFGRTRLIIAGALICTLACGLYHFSTTLALLLCLRALHGIGFGVHSTVGGVIAADVIPKSRMAEGLGYFGLYGTLAAAVAPGIALAIIGTGGAGFRNLFILATGASLLSMVLDCFITYERRNKTLERTTPAPDTQDTPTAANLPKTFLGFEYAAFMPSLVSVLLYTATSSIISFLPLFALERHFGNVGLFFTINAAGLFLSRVLLGKITDRYGAGKVVVPGLLALALCFALMPFARSTAALLWLAFPMGLAQGAVGPALNALIFSRCSVQRRGTASAAYASSIDIGYSIGSVVFGLIAAKLGYYGVYFGATGCSLAALIVFISAVTRQDRLTLERQAA